MDSPSQMAHEAPGTGARLKGVWPPFSHLLIRSPPTGTIGRRTMCRAHMGGCSPEQVVNESSEGYTDENLLLMSIGTPSITARPFNDSAVIDVRHPGTSQYWELFMSLKRGTDIH